MSIKDRLSCRFVAQQIHNKSKYWSMSFSRGWRAVSLAAISGLAKTDWIQQSGQRGNE